MIYGLDTGIEYQRHPKSSQGQSHLKVKFIQGRLKVKAIQGQNHTMSLQGQVKSRSNKSTEVIQGHFKVKLNRKGHF